MPIHKSAEDVERFWAAVDNEDIKTLSECFDENTELASRVDLDDAVAQNLVKSTRCMLEHGVDPNEAVNVINGLGKCRSMEIFSMLLEFGMDFKPFGADLLREVLDSQDIVDFLLDQGVDINATEDNGFVIQVASAPFTPHKRTTEPHPDHFDHSVRVLNRASRLGYIKMFDHLVSRGADPTRSIALHEACFCKSASRAVAMITHLVQNHNFDVNGTSEPEGVRKVCWNPAIFEGAPLGWAVYRENLLGSGDDTVVEALLALGAEPGDATELAAICGTMTALETLIKAGGSATDALACAVINNKVDAARLCLRYGADRNEVEGTERMSEEMKELLETHK